jgi:hypothetical protein
MPYLMRLRLKRNNPSESEVGFFHLLAFCNCEASSVRYLPLNIGPPVTALAGSRQTIGRQPVIQTLKSLAQKSSGRSTNRWR